MPKRPINMTIQKDKIYSLSELATESSISLVRLRGFVQDGYIVSSEKGAGNGKRYYVSGKNFLAFYKKFSDGDIKN